MTDEPWPKNAALNKMWTVEGSVCLPEWQPPQLTGRRLRAVVWGFAALGSRRPASPRRDDVARRLGLVGCGAAVLLVRLAGRAHPHGVIR
jgi:hypothetical protein